MTQKPISTISYNTLDFLIDRLNEWYDAHLIQAYQFIKHIGEDGDKDHIHLRIEPNRRIDPMDLREQLREPVDLVSKPLGCLTFRPSSEEDWFLYVTHNSDYLRLKYGSEPKGEKIPYDWHSIIVPDDYDLEHVFIRALQSLEHSSTRLAKRLHNGESAMSLVLQGENVHTVSSLVNLMNNTVYQDSVDEINRLNSEINNILVSLSDSGVSFYRHEDGTYTFFGLNR